MYDFRGLHYESSILVEMWRCNNYMLQTNITEKEKTKNIEVQYYLTPFTPPHNYMCAI